jgi:ABC-2 type transport system permease protein
MREQAARVREAVSRHAGIALAAIRERAAYRFDLATALLFSLLMMGLLHALWSAVYRDATALALPVGGALTYVCLAQAFSFTRQGQHRAIERVSQAIRTGDIGIDLLRPADFQARLLAESAGAFAVETLLVSLPAYLLARLAFGIAAPASPLAALGFATSLLGAFLLAFALNFLVIVLAFWTTSTFGLVYARKALVDVLAGAIIPLSFFPGPLQDLALALPFRGIAYTPLSIYLGTIAGPAVWASLLAQFGWAVALIALTRLVWLRALGRLVVQGG